MPSALAACRGAPPRSVLESTLYGFGGELALSARPYTYTDVFLSDRGRPHAFRGRARISSGVGMLTRKSSPARLPPGLAIVTDGPQCFGSAEPTPLGMIGCCASLAWLLAKLASGLRLVQSRAVSNVSSSVLTMGGIPAGRGPWIPKSSLRNNATDNLDAKWVGFFLCGGKNLDTKVDQKCNQWPNLLPPYTHKNRSSFFFPNSSPHKQQKPSQKPPHHSTHGTAPES